MLHMVVEQVTKVPSDRLRQQSLLFDLQHPISIIKWEIFPNPAKCFLIKGNVVFPLFLNSITLSFVY